MENKIHQILQLCLDINIEGQYEVMFDLGGHSKILFVSIYKGIKLLPQDHVFSGRVYLSTPQSEEQANKLIESLELFKIEIPCVTL